MAKSRDKIIIKENYMSSFNEAYKVPLILISKSSPFLVDPSLISSSAPLSSRIFTSLTFSLMIATNYHADQ